jgi:hypothetical protein
VQFADCVADMNSSCANIFMSVRKMAPCGLIGTNFSQEVML